MISPQLREVSSVWLRDLCLAVVSKTLPKFYPHLIFTRWKVSMLPRPLQCLKMAKVAQVFKMERVKQLMDKQLLREPVEKQ